MASLHSSILFLPCRNYNEDNDRISIYGTTQHVPEIVDNDYDTLESHPLIEFFHNVFHGVLHIIQAAQTA